jgi:hypothetical protein
MLKIMARRVPSVLVRPSTFSTVLVECSVELTRAAMIDLDARDMPHTGGQRLSAIHRSRARWGYLYVTCYSPPARDGFLRELKYSSLQLRLQTPR